MRFRSCTELFHNENFDAISDTVNSASHDDGGDRCSVVLTVDEAHCEINGWNIAKVRYIAKPHCETENSKFDGKLCAITRPSTATIVTLPIVIAFITVASHC